MTSKNARAMRAKPKVAYRHFHSISARRPASPPSYVGRKKLFSKKAGNGIANAYGDTAQARTIKPTERSTVPTSHPGVLATAIVASVISGTNSSFDDGLMVPSPTGEEGENDDDKFIVTANKER